MVELVVDLPAIEGGGERIELRVDECAAALPALEDWPILLREPDVLGRVRPAAHAAHGGYAQPGTAQAVSSSGAPCVRAGRLT